MNEKIEIWIDGLEKNLSDRDADLIRRAANTIDGNVFRGRKFPWDPYVCISPGFGGYDGIWNWDSAFHAMTVSRWDCDLGKDSIYGFFKFQDEKGMLPDVIWENGKMADQFTKPPVFAQAVWCVYQRCMDKNFIGEMYPKLYKNAEFWCNYRLYDGLFYYDAFNKGEPSYLQNAQYETGWDDSVRWDVPVYELWAIDLNCFMVDYYHAMSYLAAEIGKENDSKMWKKRAQQLADLINERLWDEKQHSYVDVNKYTGEKSSALSPASFMPLYSGIAPARRAEFMNHLASDQRKFYSGMPTVAYDNPEYSTTYWRGPTWLNVAYFAAKGLKNYGFSVGDDIKNTILNWCDKDKRGIFENYNSITGEGLRCDHFSWSSAFIIEFILNF